MEWCRMNTLRAVICVVLLCCGLHCVVPDRLPDGQGRQSMSDTDRKRQELLRSLDAYAKELDPKSSTVTSSTTTTTPSLLYFPTMPTSLRHPDARSRGGPYPEVQSENLLPDNPEIKSYQDFYRVFYGTQEGVNLLRKQYGPNGLQKARAKYGAVERSMNDVRAANDHFSKIRERTKCLKPTPQVVKVKDYYPDPSKDYLPRCTILHRCGDHTGCCELNTEHCAPSAFQEVTLHFYVLIMGKHGIRNPNRSSIEKLLFVNHTACSCRPINDLPRIEDGRDLAEEEATTKSKCGECPVPFTSRIYKDGRCGCDCFDKQKPCIRIKRGREPLPDIERRCVEANHCHIPDCEYGLYDSQSGFCPRRHDEDQRVPHRRQTHGSPSQRWAFLERD